MQTAEMLLHQALVKPGVTAEIRHTDGTGIPIYAGGYLGELGANRHLNSLSLTLVVDPKGFSSNLLNVHIFQIDGDRNIMDIIREQGEDGKTRFNDTIEVEYTGKHVGQNRFHTNPETAFMIATYDDTGKVVVTVVTVVVQDCVRFYLASQTTRELQVYRDARGVVTTPDLIGKFCRWDDLEERIVEVYDTKTKSKLPSLNDHQPVKHDGSDLPDNNHLRVIWSSLRRQMSAGVRKDGKTVRLSWSQVEAKNITDEENRVSYPGLKFLRQGEVVKVGDYVRTQDPRSEIKIEAQSIQHTH